MRTAMRLRSRPCTNMGKPRGSTSWHAASSRKAASRSLSSMTGSPGAHPILRSSRGPARAIEDIREAAKVLRPVFEATKGADGYVSLEVSPYLAMSTESTVAEARRLWGAVGRENVMIKVPATAAGLPAIRQLIGEGINVNITLLFSQDVYEQVVEAYLAGLEQFVGRGGEPGKVA